jgi:hypothetical protein
MAIPGEYGAKVSKDISTSFSLLLEGISLLPRAGSDFLLAVPGESNHNLKLDFKDEETLDQALVLVNQLISYTRRKIKKKASKLKVKQSSEELLALQKDEETEWVCMEDATHWCPKKLVREADERELIGLLAKPVFVERTWQQVPRGARVIGTRFTRRVKGELCKSRLVLQDVRRSAPIGGELFADEAIVGHVAIEGTDDIVAVAPGMGPDGIVLETVAFREASEIQPVAAPAFAVVGRVEELSNQ